MTDDEAYEGPMVEISGDADDMFVVFNGVKIAKRGHPDTPQAGTWISLEPGWTVRMSKNYATIEIEHNGVRVH